MNSVTDRFDDPTMGGMLPDWTQRLLSEELSAERIYKDGASITSTGAAILRITECRPILSRKMVLSGAWGKM